MKERKDIIVKTYQISDDERWFIETVEADEIYDAYIYDINCGIKMYMFGINKKDMAYNDFLEIVESNIEDYYETYNEEYNF